MGIYNRDYIRESQPSSPFGGSSLSWAIKYLLIANIALFVLQNMTDDVQNGDDGVITHWMTLEISNIFPNFQLWRLLSYGFIHGGLMHLAFNMYVLWMFGRLIEPIYGSREFLAFYLSAIVISGLCFLGVHAFQEQPVAVMGASGGVMAIVFLTAMHYPRMKVLLFFVIPVEFRWLALGIAVLDLTGMISGSGGIAHAAHLGGAAFGVAYHHYHWNVIGSWNRLTSGLSTRKLVRPLGRPKVRLYQPSREDLDVKVDAILEKIHREGEASLSDKERKILKDASRRYKNQ